MGQWLEALKKKNAPHEQLTKPTKDPFVSSVSCQPIGIQKNKRVLRVNSTVLNQEILVVPDDCETGKEWNPNVYLDSEVALLNRDKLSSEGVQAVHLVRSVFEGVVVDV
jgi:hypothetical protein